MCQELLCGCGRVVVMQDGQESASCECGNVVAASVASGDGQVAHVATGADQQPAAAAVVESVALERKSPENTELLSPAVVSCRSRRSGTAESERTVIAAVASDAIWLQDSWAVRRLPLRSVASIESPVGAARDLVLMIEPPELAPAERSTSEKVERIRLRFASPIVRERWATAIGQRQAAIEVGASAASEPLLKEAVLEGIALVVKKPTVPFRALQGVEFAAATPELAARGLQLRAAMQGGSAVIEVIQRQCPELGWRGSQQSGVAIAVDGYESQRRLRLQWYAESVGTLVKNMFRMLGTVAVLLLAFSGYQVGLFTAPTGLSWATELVQSAAWMAVLFSWPILLLMALWFVRWPELLRAAGVAVAAAITGRGIAVIVGHLAAIWIGQTPWEQSKIWYLFDPVDWLFIAGGCLYGVRCWRLAADTKAILPAEDLNTARGRHFWDYGLQAVSVVYLAALVGFIGHTRYEQSIYILQPGIQAKREQQARQLLFDGWQHTQKENELAQAETSVRRSLVIWEELTKDAAGQKIYNGDLATALCVLGWVMREQKQPEEAEKLYARAVELADQLPERALKDKQFAEDMQTARVVLAELRGGTDAKLMDQKDREGDEKYEQGQLKWDKEPAESERLIREAITLWEEVLQQATSVDWRKGAITQLSVAYHRVAELQRRQDKRWLAETSLAKAIEYGEQAVSLNPDKPLVAKHLEETQSFWEDLRQESIQDQFIKLLNERQFADIVELYVKDVKLQEEQLAKPASREGATRRLGFRLDRLAWFLVHCPDVTVRDTRAAVAHARRAAELDSSRRDYLYTLALAQSRNGEYTDSLATLEKMKPPEGDYDGFDWLLFALNRHHLRQPDSARKAHQRAVEWIDEWKQKSQGSPVKAYQYERIRIDFEPLRREVEALLEGKEITPADRSRIS